MSNYDAKDLQRWAKSTIVRAGTFMPNWSRFTLARLQFINLPMSTWNLKLVNVQKATRNHVWNFKEMMLSANAEHTTDEPEDLLRIPANGKSMFSLEEVNAKTQQHRFIISFLASTGVNSDLVHKPADFRSAPPIVEYRPPTALNSIITEPPEDLAADLYQCTRSSDHTYTVEDKDPSVLWRMSDHRIFDYWFLSYG